MRTWMVFVVALSVLGCASVPKPGSEAKAPYRHAPDGSVIWEEEFQFDPPPNAWRLMQVDSGDEFGFAFLKLCQQSSVCGSTFAYDEEPFGDSHDLAERMQQFYARFLWASRIRFGELRTEA